MLNTDGSMQSSFGELPTVLDEWIGHLGGFLRQAWGPWWAFLASVWSRVSLCR
jgi:hypothetical protein